MTVVVGIAYGRLKTLNDNVVDRLGRLYTSFHGFEGKVDDELKEIRTEMGMLRVAVAKLGGDV